MLLLEVSMEGFKVILQIVLWIAIPAILIATAIVYFLHHRKVKAESMYRLQKLENRHLDNSSDIHSDTGGVYELPTDMDYSKADQLVTKYQKEIRHTTERHELLEREYARLEEKYLELLATKNANSERLLLNSSSFEEMEAKTQQYETKIAELQKELVDKRELEYDAIAKWKRIIRDKEKALEEKENRLATLELELDHYTSETTKLNDEISTLREASSKDLNINAGQLELLLKQQSKETEQAYKNEISVLLTRIENANQEIRRLKDMKVVEVHAPVILTENIQSADRESIIMQEKLLKAEEEKAYLRTQVVEEKYLQDLLQEKNAQISFLQVQLEQRLKGYRDMEHQRLMDADTIKDMDETVKRNEADLYKLKHFLQQKDTEIVITKEQLEEEKRVVQRCLEDINYRDASIEEIKKEADYLQYNNVRLETNLKNSINAIGTLNQDLFESNGKIVELEKKLDLSSQLLVKIYKELARSFGTTILSNLGGQERLTEKETSLLNRTAGDPPLIAIKE